MIILIDAYNILKQLHDKALITDSERRLFVQTFEEYAARQGHRVFVIFDGGDTMRPVQQQQQGQVTVIYAGMHSTADDVIRRLCDMFVGYEVLVVSSDRAIIDYAMHYGIPSVDSVDFFKQVVHFTPEPLRIERVDTTVRKLSQRVSPELDSLMEKGTEYMVYKSEEDTITDRRAKRHTLSKQEKRLRTLVKKL